MSKLNKQAMMYAKNNNYYKISKIKKYLKLFHERIKELYDDLGVSICPECGNTKSTLSSEEYSADTKMFCMICGCDYNDNEYIEKLTEIENYKHFDVIPLMVWGQYESKPPKTYSWFKECDTEMDRMIKELS